MSERSSPAAVTSIVRRYGVDSGKRLFMVRILQEAAADRIKFAKSGAHRHHRSAGGKIASTAIAKPAAVRSHIDVLCDGKLAA